MSRLDSHVAQVRGKMFFDRLLGDLAWALLTTAAIALIALACNRLFWWTLPQPWIWLGGVGAIAFIVAVVKSWRASPTPEHAAVEIDRRLNLKEKYSSALKLRGDADPFARAAVLDAEQTAAKVRLENHFPLSYPRITTYALTACLAVALTVLFVPKVAYPVSEAEQAKKDAAAQQQEARQHVQTKLASLSAMPQDLQSDEAVRKAKSELEALLQRPNLDPDTARRSAHQALQDVDKSISRKISDVKNFLRAVGGGAALRQMSPPKNGAGPVAKAHAAMAEGRFTDAYNDLGDAAAKFDQLSKKEKDKAAEDMQKLADDLKKVANDPQTRQKIEEKLKQLGADKQQAQDMADKIQKAAAGDKKAQQDVQNQVNNLMNQMNNGQGATQQQRQQVQNIMNQAQNAANQQQQAQQMANAAQQMANGMQQGANQGGQGAQGQAGGAQQQIAQGAQQMQNQLGQMGNAQKQLNQLNNAQGGVQQAMNQGQGGQQPGQQPGQGQGQGQQGQGGQQPGAMAGGQGQGQGQGQQGQGQGGWQPGQPNGQGGAGGGPGQGMGERAAGEESPFTTKSEFQRLTDNKKGKLLASHFVKDKGIRGESRATLREVVQAGETEVTDEIDQDRIPRSAEKSVKEYFRSITPEE